ncbi:MAG: Nif3-like dinuclear metal center hexameric protein [Acidaminococcaceae bacterium]|nr:Nif3-like dinuclear metal center hexameric protein [Acidaminococcaceae bacterium]
MNILVKELVKIMGEMVPARLAEDWDNVGLQLGRNEKEVRVILCALDFSAEVLEQASQLHADIIVTHHPAIFRSIKQFTDRDWRTGLLLEAARKDIAVYSAHTNLDSVAGGVNDVLANLLELQNVEGFAGEDSMEGIGRVGVLKEISDINVFADKIKSVLKLKHVTVIPAGRPVHKVAVCGGSGMDFLDCAVQSGADTYVTGDVKFHDAQEALGKHINLIDATHQGTELPVVNELADRLALRLSREGYTAKVLVAKETQLLQTV